MSAEFVSPHLQPRRLARGLHQVQPAHLPAPAVLVGAVLVAVHLMSCWALLLFRHPLPVLLHLLAS